MAAWGLKAAKGEGVYWQTRSAARWISSNCRLAEGAAGKSVQLAAMPLTVAVFKNLPVVSDSSFNWGGMLYPINEQIPGVQRYTRAGSYRPPWLAPS